MRHRNSGRQLSRNASHRHAMLRNMAASLLRHETIRTTVPKAKELRRVVEPLITLAKVDSLGKRRLAYSRGCATMPWLRSCSTIWDRASRPGPAAIREFCKMEPRPGDSADMALMQLVDAPAAPVEKTEEPKAAKAPKAPRKSKKAAADDGEAAAAAAPKRRKAKKAAA